MLRAARDAGPHPKERAELSSLPPLAERDDVAHLPAVRRLPAEATARGWTVHEKPGTLNFWRHPEDAALPRGYHHAAGRYFDRRLYRDFRRAMAANFGAKTAFMEELDAMHRTIENRLRTVVLYHESGAVAGAGLVATEAPGAFLYCGSISAPHRGKGLWRALVALRQLVSTPQGAQVWATSTRVPRLMGKGDASFPLSVLVKNTA